MTDTARRILLGRIVAAHGIRGEVVVDSYTAEPGAVAGYGPLLSEDGTRSFELTAVRVTPRGVIARVAGVDDRNAAEALRGTALYTTRDRLPAAAEDEYYHADLVGLSAIDAQGNPVGEVIAVQNYGAGDLLEIRLAGQRVSELVPFTDPFVPNVDLFARTVVILLPTVVPDEDDEAG